MTDSTDEVDWYDGPEQADDWCDCGCTVKIKRLGKRIRLLEKELRKILKIPRLKQIDEGITICICGHGAKDHKHLDNCFGPACACTRFKETP